MDETREDFDARQQGSRPRRPQGYNIDVRAPLTFQRASGRSTIGCSVKDAAA
jgi:hypothetical protein